MAYISNIKGDKAIDTIADLIGPISEIASDEACADLFRKKAIPKGMTAYAFTIKRVKDSLPVLLRNHKGALVTIFALVNGVTEDEYRESMTIPKLVHDIVDILNDDELKTLFT